MTTRVVEQGNFSKNLAKLLKGFDSATKKKVGKAVVREMKGGIRKGISPIRGKGRFPGYKDPKKYPGKRKSQRPVNLKLTGAFLKDLIFRISGGNLVIQFRTQLSALKEDGHRTGANKQRKRPIIPNAPREQFAVRIMNKVIPIVEKALRKLR